MFYVFDVPETSVLSQQQLAWTWGDNSNICGNYGEDSFNERLLSGVSNPPKDVLIVWINYAIITAKKKKNEPKENRPKPQKQPSLCQSNYENNDFLILMKKQLFFLRVWIFSCRCQLSILLLLLLGRSWHQGPFSCPAHWNINQRGSCWAWRVIRCRLCLSYARCSFWGRPRDRSGD